MAGLVTGIEVFATVIAGLVAGGITLFTIGWKLSNMFSTQKSSILLLEEKVEGVTEDTKRLTIKASELSTKTEALSIQTNRLQEAVNTMSTKIDMLCHHFKLDAP